MSKKKRHLLITATPPNREGPQIVQKVSAVIEIIYAGATDEEIKEDLESAKDFFRDLMHNKLSAAKYSIKEIKKQ